MGEDVLILILSFVLGVYLRKGTTCHGIFAWIDSSMCAASKGAKFHQKCQSQDLVEFLTIFIHTGIV